ncbi:MAG: Arc family DNA-binding protein [Caulobacteraceae bacterium]|nr:Arc family DNA-binding protein [Caulobacteraceae bacterium]
MSANSRKGEARKAFLMRISPGVLAQIERLAAAELRSVNAEVEVLLREALARRGLSGTPPKGGDD